MKLIDLHKEWERKGEIRSTEQGDGLCHAIPQEYRCALGLFKPRFDTWRLVFPKMYWAHSTNPPKDSRAWKEYTPLRQTIVLLICVMNNEL